MRTSLSYFILRILFVVLASFSLVNSGYSSNGSDSAFIFESLYNVYDNPVVEQLIANRVMVLAGTSAKVDGLVVDGSIMSSAELESSTMIRDYLRAEKVLLLLNATGAHKQALVKHIGIAFGDDTSLAYCIIPDPDSQGRIMTILDHPSALQIDPEEIRQNFANVNDWPVEFDEQAFLNNQQQFVDDLEEVSGPERYAVAIIARLQENRTLPAGEAGEDIPPNLKYYSWRYIPDYTWYHDNIWLKQDGNYLYWVYPATPPMQGYQSGRCSPTIYVNLYLDNAPSNANGDYQWLLVDHQGVSNPISGPNSVDSSTTVKMPIDGKSYKLYNSGIKLDTFGYGQMTYGFSFVPQFSDLSNFHFNQSSPPNANNVTSYTSGYNFTVGFSNSGVNASVGISNSTSTEISDWGVVNSSNNAAMSFDWYWTSQNPEYTKHINKLNNLMKTEFEPNSSGVLQTKTLCTDKLDFEMTYGVDQVSWDGHYGVIHEYVGRYDIKGLMQNQKITIDFASVLYPIMESISISPDQVQGGTTTTGTVTVDSPAPAGGVIVSLSSSNTDWATVPDTVTIPEGQQSNTFSITTYAVTQSSTATIYATLNKVQVNETLTVTP